MKSMRQYPKTFERFGQLGQSWLDLAGGQLGCHTRLLHIAGTCQGHAHAAFDKALGLAKQTQISARDGQRFIHTIKDQTLGILAAVNHSTRAGVAQTGIHRQAQNGAGVQFKLTLPLGYKRNQSCVMRTG